MVFDCTKTKGVHIGGKLGRAEEDLWNGMGKGQVSFIGSDGKRVTEKHQISDMSSLDKHGLVISSQYRWFGPPHPLLQDTWAMKMIRHTDTRDIPKSFRSGECFSLTHQGVQLEMMLLGMRRESQKLWNFVFLLDFHSLIAFKEHPKASNKYETIRGRIFYREMSVLFG